MTFHVVAMPQTLTTRHFSMCGFTQKTINFCGMMKALGNKVFLYGGSENEAVCDEHVICFTENDRKIITKHSGHYAFPSWDPNNEIWKKTNQTVIKEIKKRKQKNDFICIVQGLCQKEISDAFPDIKTVEYGIGYEGFFSKWKIFESHAWRSYCTAKCLNNYSVSIFDDVINNFFDERQFCPVFKKKPYALFFGRIIRSKGIEDCCDAAMQAGINLKVAGFGDLSLIKNAEYLGQPSLEERNKLIAGASVVMCPSRFFEPFGNVACEAQLSATPVICTNWGGFVETVEHKKTGFRCSTIKEMVEALKNLEQINNYYVLARAIEMFSIKNKMHEYQRYFERIYDS